MEILCHFLFSLLTNFHLLLYIICRIYFLRIKIFKLIENHLSLNHLWKNICLIILSFFQSHIKNIFCKIHPISGFILIYHNCILQLGLQIISQKFPLVSFFILRLCIHQWWNKNKNQKKQIFINELCTIQKHKNHPVQIIQDFP